MARGSLPSAARVAGRMAASMWPAEEEAASQNGDTCSDRGRAVPILQAVDGGDVPVGTPMPAEPGRLSP